MLTNEAHEHDAHRSSGMRGTVRKPSRNALLPMTAAALRTRGQIEQARVDLALSDQTRVLTSLRRGWRRSFTACVHNGRYVEPCALRTPGFERALE